VGTKTAINFINPVLKKQDPDYRTVCCCPDRPNPEWWLSECLTGITLMGLCCYEYVKESEQQVYREK